MNQLSVRRPRQDVTTSGATIDSVALSLIRASNQREIVPLQMSGGRMNRQACFVQFDVGHKLVCFFVNLSVGCEIFDCISLNAATRCDPV